MKPATVAGALVGVFLVGVGVGAIFGKSSPTPDSPGKVATGPQATPAERPDPINLGGPQRPSNPGPGATAPTPGKTPGVQPGPAPRPDGPTVRESAERMTQPLNPAPRDPLPVDATALREGERAARDLEANPRGGGRVTPLVYDFDSPEEAEAWEQRRRETWQRRRAREIDIKLSTLTEKVGISPSQAQQLRGILEAENAERTRLVDLLTGKEISRGTFDESVKANLTKAREQVKSLLTEEQYQAYSQLDPREQVLRDEVK